MDYYSPRKHASPSSSSLSSSTRRTCLCSPTNHPGSFRCARHRASGPKLARKAVSDHLNYYNKKTNLIKEFLLKIIKPTGHEHLQRRKEFEPKPSRFFVLNHAAGNELSAVS